MHGRPVPVALFTDALRKWHAAFDAGRLEDAQRAADEISAVGMMLAIDPEFRALFNRCRGPDDPDEPTVALRAIRTFLGALTETGTPGTYRSGLR